MSNELLEIEVFIGKDSDRLTPHSSGVPPKRRIPPFPRVEKAKSMFTHLTMTRSLCVLRLASNLQLTDALLLANDLRRKAEVANRTKDEFMANMSHELRTPMNGVLGMASVLQLSTLSEEQELCVDSIISSGESLVKIIGEILDLAKIEAGKMEIENSNFDLREMLFNLETLYRSQAQNRNIRLVFSIAPDVPATATVSGDSVRIRQILENLINNALKFTLNGGVTVLTTLVRAVGHSPQAMELRFAVQDTGIGIPEDKLDRLFQKFSQVDSSTTRKFGGTGLGLVITKQLAELMGGQIGVISEFGVGSEFWFTLTLQKRDCRESSSTSAFATTLGASLTSKQLSSHILLVEDNLVNQRVACHLLRKLGLCVTVANNGEEALDMVAGSPGIYSLVLMDIQMPGMDGYECTRQLRGLDSVRVPIVAMTANAMSEDRQRCIDAGMDDHLAKPVSLPRLLETLATWLPVE